MDDEKTTVLLIEDNPGDARLIREYLSESGSYVFRLEHVERLSYGLKFLDECNIGIILLDLTLPDSQGLEGLLKILMRAPDVPVVVLSGIKDEAIAIEAVHVGAQDYLVKGSIDGTLLVRLLLHAIERQHLRVALQESESRYRLLADNIADVVWVADEKGWITYVSPSVEHLLGYTVEEMEKLRIRDILTPDSAEQARRFIRNQMEVGVQQSRSTPLSLTLEHVRKDGSTVWSEVMLSFLLDKKGNLAGIMGSTRDVTARKRAEEALQRSEEHFRSLIENASDAILIINGDGVLKYESPSIQRLLGYRFEERLGKSVFENIHPDDRKNVIDAFVQLVQEVGKITQMEMRVRHNNGSWRIIDVTAKNLLDNPAVDGIVANFRDVTDRKKAEEARRESETRFRTVFEGTSVAMALIDKRGMPLGINPAFCRIFGYSFEEFCSLNKLKYLYPDDAMVDAGLYLELINGKRDHYTIDKRFVRKDGEVLWGRQNLSAVRDAEGKPEYFIAMVEDITERKRIEEELRRSEERYRELFENANDIIYTHDLKGKFTSINRAAELVTGYTRNEVLTMNIAQILPPESLRLAKEMIAAKVKEGGRTRYELEIIARDGRRILLEVSTRVIYQDGNPVGVQGIARDITERKKMEQELIRLSDAVKMSTDSVVITDLAGRVVEANEAALKIQGAKSRDELIGLRPFDAIVPEDMEKAFADLAAIVEKAYINEVRYRVKTRDGRVIFLETNASLMKNRDGVTTGIVAVSRDITERKRMDEALRDSEEKHRLYFESVSDVIYSIDRELRVTSVSPSVEKVLGYKPEELIGRIFPEINILAPESMECAIPTALGVLNGERAISEWIFITKDGARKYGEVISTPLFGPDGKVTGALGVGRDITERKHIEEALRFSEHDYKVLFESTLDGLIVLDAGTMKIVLANQTAGKLAGVSSSDALIGLDPFEFIPIENRDATRNLVREDVFEKDLHRIHEYRVFTSDGKEIWVSAVSTRTEYQGRKAALISIRDITERKKAEEEKQKMEEQLRLAGRLAAVGELASGVAHELNNPITAVQGYAQLLAAKKDIDESVKKDLNTIYREAQRAGKITRNLLSFARRHEPEKRFISINEALEKTLELSSHQMKLHNIELEVELDRNLPGTMADFHQMQQIFVNIINNAEQAMLDAHGKGKLIVRTRRHGDMLQIVFTDNGPGIAEENLKRVFDPFFTTKGVGKGTGLGLSICYGLVEAHNGRIYARSNPGEGATFVVEIPIVPEKRPAAETVGIQSKKESARWRR